MFCVQKFRRMKCEYREIFLFSLCKQIFEPQSCLHDELFKNQIINASHPGHAAKERKKERKAPQRFGLLGNIPILMQILKFKLNGIT